MRKHSKSQTVSRGKRSAAGTESPPPVVDASAGEVADGWPVAGEILAEGSSVFAAAVMTGALHGAGVPRGATTADGALDGALAGEVDEVSALAAAAEAFVEADVGDEAFGDDVVGDPILDPSSEGDAELAEAGDASLPTSAASMDDLQLTSLIEALIFAADRPVTLQRLRQLTRIADVSRINAALARLAASYEGRGIQLQSVSGGYQLRTQTVYSAWVQQLIAGRPVKLSRAQLETLALVAYRQPITRPEIDDIRGVDSSNTLRVLLDRGLVRTLGRREEVGRPTLFGTTKEFLDFFSLGDLRELPTLREYAELSEESHATMTKLGVEAADPEMVASVVSETLAAAAAAASGQSEEASDAIAAALGDEIVAAPADDDAPVAEAAVAAAADDDEAARGPRGGVNARDVSWAEGTGTSPFNDMDADDDAGADSESP